jgi:hypothetical protein
MKNIHLLSTDKPSILVKINDELFFANNEREMLSDTSLNIVAQHIYITSDEEIKEGDWYYWIVTNMRIKAVRDNLGRLPKFGDGSKKIILTTDQDLIADGVQSIDDTFLEWFVKNPGCEVVEVKKLLLCTYCGGEHCDNLACRGWEDKPYYEVIIPQEEAKQETLEEAAENFANSKEWMNGGSSNWVQFSFKNGAKWQAERSYSKEEVLQIYKDYESYVIKTPITEVIEFSKWFEQFKKK